MEHIIVYAVDNSDRKVTVDSNVLINKKVCGKVGNQIQVDAGSMDISIDMSSAETRRIIVDGTSATRPKKINVRIFAKGY